MKYNKKSEAYEASNVFFSPSKMSAYSYNWWRFVKMIDGVIYFNNYGYSITTRKHQGKVRRVMDELGISYTIVNTVKSLDDAYSTERLMEMCIEQEEIDKKNQEIKRQIRNEKARMRRLKMKTA